MAATSTARRWLGVHVAVAAGAARITPSSQGGFSMGRLENNEGMLFCRLRCSDVYTSWQQVPRQLSE
jgi:hypothetical protein